MNGNTNVRNAGHTVLRLEGHVDRITSWMAVFSGCLFLLLAFFMTIDVSSRQLGGPFTGVADEIASFVLALGGTWSLAYALSSGSHVRIDVLTPVYPARMNRILKLWGFLMVVVFAAILAFKAWELVFASYAMNALVPQSMLEVPICIPQGFAAIGFSTLVLQGTAMFVVGVARFVDSSLGADGEDEDRTGAEPKVPATGG